MDGPTEATEATGPALPGPPASAGADAPRRRSSRAAVAAAGVAVGGGAFLLGAAVLAVSSRGAGDARQEDDVAAELASLRKDIAGSSSGGAGSPARAEGLRAELERLSARIAGLERALSGEQSERIAGLEKALGDAEAARKAGEAALLAKGMRGPLHVYVGAARGAGGKGAPAVGPPVDGGRGPDAGLAQALGEMDRAAGLPSTPEASARFLEQLVKGYQKQRAAHQKHQEAVRGRCEKLRQTVEKQVLKVVGQIHAKARAAEKAKDWQTALACYRDIAGIRVAGAEKLAAEGGRKVQEIQRRIEAPAQARREAGPEARPAARPGKPAAGAEHADEEVF